MSLKKTSEAEFDAFADNYSDELHKGLSLTGENKEYFAEKRIQWLIGCLKKHNFLQPKKILDFGCGDGGSVPFLNDAFQPARIVGVDISEKSIEIAKKKYSGINAEFYTIKNFPPKAEFDMAFCNGVFHHIPLAERQTAVNYVFQSLQAYGLFAFWENNPWNPGTRYVMSRIPFDKDAITLSFLEAKTLLAKSGFETLESNFLFFFPAIFGRLRFVERYLSNIPFGGQYMILGRKGK